MSPRSRIPCKRVEDDVDDGRRQPERGLVEQQHVGARDERARDRELLLLPAGERARVAGAGTPARSGTARTRPPCRRPPPRALRRPARPSRRFSSTVSSAKMRRPSGTSATPLRATSSGARPRATLRRAGSPPPRAADDSHDRVQGRRLAGAVRPDQPDDLAAPHLEREVADGCDAAVRDVEPVTARASRLAHALLLVHGALAEIRRGDIEVGADLGRRSLREGPTLVEHLDPIADVHDQRHVVIDQQHTGAVVVAHGAHHCRELGYLRLGQPGRRLVHQHERRLRRERTRHSEPPLVPVRRAPPPEHRRSARARAARESRPRAPCELRGDAPTPSAATSTFSRTDSEPEGV